MEISPIEILQMTLVSFIFGAVVGVVNDIHRIIRVIFGCKYNSKSIDKLHNINLPVPGKPLDREMWKKANRYILPIIVFFQDIIIFAFSGVGIVILNYYFNNGRLRIYAPLGVILGFFTYYFTLGKVAIYFSELFAFSPVSLPKSHINFLYLGFERN